jgi:hypothetical protein
MSVNCEIHDGRALVRIEGTQLSDVLSRLRDDRTVRVVILVFPAAPETAELRDPVLCNLISSYRVPVIAAGGESELAQACHLRRPSLADAESLAAEIAQLAPLAIRACLRAVNEGLKLPLSDGLALETELFASLFETNDMREGTAAFLEKRKPRFSGT